MAWGESTLKTPTRENDASSIRIMAEAAPRSLAPLWPWPFLVFALVALAVIAPFFFRGNPSGHDFEFHLNSWIEVNQQWRAGVIYPRWAEGANYAYGEPRFIFYPPLSWMLGGGLGMVLPWKAVPGAYIYLALVVSACSMFFLARRWVGPRDAVFAAVLYAANPYYLLMVYWRSAFAELLAACVLPLLLLFLFRLGDVHDDAPERDTSKTVTVLALLVAAAWLCDAPVGVMVNYSFVLLVAAVAIARRSPRIAAYGGLALAAGFGLAAFYLLPAAYEQKWVDIYQIVSRGVRPRDNFLFTMINDPDHNQVNLLFSAVAAAQVVLLAMAALWWRQWRRRLPGVWWMAALWAAFSAWLMFPLSSFAWRYLPKLSFMQFPWRWLLCMNVAFALLVAMAWRRWAARAAIAAALLAVVILAGHYILPPWWDTADDVAELQDNIQSGAGYEGTDEYLPVSADPDRVEQNARRVTYQGSGSDHIRIRTWGPEEKIFSASISAPGKLVLQLFNYPAWRVTVNGRTVGAQNQNGGGQLAIPVQPGENLVRVIFTRTWDRTLGGWISLATFVILGGGVMAERKRTARLGKEKT